MGEQVARVAVEIAGVGHHVLAVAGPAFDHRPGLEDAAKLRLVLVGMGKLQQMAGNGLVDRQLVDRPLVVFAQERGRLLRAPVRRDGHDVVIAALVLLQGARHVGISDGDAARIFGHFDDVKVRRGEGDQVPGFRECNRFGERAFCELQDLLARRDVGIDLGQPRLDHGLLLIRGRIGGRWRRAGIAFDHSGGDFVHSGAKRLELALGARTDFLPAERRVEGEAQLLVVEHRADPLIALRVGDERLVDPRLMLGNGSLRRRGGAFKASLVGGRERIFFREDLVDQRIDPRILLRGGLRVDQRNTRRIQCLARLCEIGRKCFEPAGRGAQPIGKRGEFARHQRE